MRHHFHRCASLRVITLPATAVHGARGRGHVVLEELCEARGLSPCVGLAECDILTPGQKQELLVERATRIREEEARPTSLSGVPQERAKELDQLRERWLDERSTIVQENQRVEAERGGAEDRGILGSPDEEAALDAAGIRLRVDAASAALQVQRLDELDRALAAMRDPAYGTCALCGGGIAIDRLRAFPGSRVCAACAGQSRA